MPFLDAGTPNGLIRKIQTVQRSGEEIKKMHCEVGHMFAQFRVEIWRKINKTFTYQTNKSILVGKLMH